MKNVVSKGTAYTSSDIDYTVKVEATGLSAFTQYYYQFTVCNSTNSSPIGKTKTTPNPNDPVAAVKLAVYSCSNYNFGFFNSFGNPARKESVDFVIHLGDFIYEYAEGAYGWGWSIGRIPKPNAEIRSLLDYRTRHNSYRIDPDSIASFQNFAWIPVWDDHEGKFAHATFLEPQSDNDTQSRTMRTGMVWQIRTTPKPLSSSMTSSMVVNISPSISAR